MPRTAQFDPEEALDSALDVFWRRGYAGASVQELLKAMGLNRASLYATFGDKQSLFTRVLDRYQQGCQGYVLHMLEAEENPAAGIRKVFEFSLVGLPDEFRNRGCLLVNTITELAEVFPFFSRDASVRLQPVEQAFCKALQRAQERNELNPAISVEEGGRLLLATMTGMRVLSRTESEPEVLRQMYMAALKLLFPEYPK